MANINRYRKRLAIKDAQCLERRCTWSMTNSSLKTNTQIGTKKGGENR